MAAVLSGIVAAGRRISGARSSSKAPPGGFPPTPPQPGIHQGFGAGAGVPLGRGGFMGMPGHASEAAPEPLAGRASDRAEVVGVAIRFILAQGFKL